MKRTVWQYDEYLTTEAQLPSRRNATARHPLLDLEDHADEELYQAWEVWEALRKMFDETDADYWVRLESSRVFLFERPRIRMLRVWDVGHTHPQFVLITYTMSQFYECEKIIDDWVGPVRKRFGSKWKWRTTSAFSQPLTPFRIRG